MRILVTGSRDWDDWETLSQAIIDAWRSAGCPPWVTVIQGGARGADFMAEQLARKVCWKVETYPANWNGFGRGAGMIRNREMIATGADVCLAFIRNQSRGATHCANEAEKAGIPVRRYTASDLP